MSEIENILHLAYKKGLYPETMSLAQDIKKDIPEMEQADRYEVAYHKAKRAKRNAFPPLD